MKLKEVCAHCALDENELGYYRDAGVFPADFGAETELTDALADVLCVAALLREAGLGKERIAAYFNGGTAEKIRVLKGLRSDILDGIHEKSKLLDKLDYILYGLKQGNGI